MATPSLIDLLSPLFYGKLTAEQLNCRALDLVRGSEAQIHGLSSELEKHLLDLAVAELRLNAARRERSRLGGMASPPNCGEGIDLGEGWAS